MRLGNLGTALHIYPKSIEMNILALNHANDHPTERLEMTDILPLNIALTQILSQRMIKDGQWKTLI
jgi:hypothetical protein